MMISSMLFCYTCTALHCTYHIHTHTYTQKSWLFVSFVIQLSYCRNKCIRQQFYTQVNKLLKLYHRTLVGHTKQTRLQCCSTLTFCRKITLRGNSWCFTCIYFFTSMKTCIFAIAKCLVRYSFLLRWKLWICHLTSKDGKHATVYKIVITSLCFYKNKILAIQNTC